jgi:hypothetical protein
VTCRRREALPYEHRSQDSYTESTADGDQVGVIVGLISTSLQAIGLTLQLKSHLLEDEKHPYDVRRPPYKRRRWQVGMGMFVVSNIVGSTIQITTLPLPVLSTLQAVSSPPHVVDLTC